MRIILASILFAGLLSIGAIAAEPSTQPSAQAANKFCPVTGDPIDKVDPALTTVYEGKTIAFCCKDCPEKFQKDPEKYMKDLK
jgi:YHS domain-containing protein